MVRYLQLGLNINSYLLSVVLGMGRRWRSRRPRCRPHLGTETESHSYSRLCQGETFTEPEGSDVGE